MEKQKNARHLLSGLTGLTKPDLTTLQKPDLGAMFANLGAPRGDDPKKKRAGEAVGIGADTLVHHEGPKRRLTYDLTKAGRATKVLKRLPDPEESFHCLMSGDYDGFDLVIAVHHLAGATIEELHLATLGFNRHNLSHLCAMIDGRDVGRAHLLCSDYFSGADPELYAHARDELGRRGQRCAAVRNHAKVLLFAIGARRFVVESSANLRSCNNLEQFALIQSPTLHAFHAGWIDRVITHANGA